MIPAFGEVGEALRRSTVHVRDGKRSGGSGVIWDSEGLVVTNSHVATRRTMTSCGTDEPIRRTCARGTRGATWRLSP